MQDPTKPVRNLQYGLLLSIPSAIALAVAESYGLVSPAFSALMTMVWLTAFFIGVIWVANATSAKQEPTSGELESDDDVTIDLKKYHSPLNRWLERKEQALLGRDQFYWFWLARQFNALWLAPIMRVTGFRFSKLYRWGATPAHRIVYIFVDTVKANIRADHPNDSSWGAWYE